MSRTSIVRRILPIAIISAAIGLSLLFPARGPISGLSVACAYGYGGAPGVTGVSPNAGDVAGGTTVIVTGCGFTGATAVKFGTTAGTGLTVDSSTQITITSPAHAAGAVDVTVTTPAGTSATSAADTYTFVSVVPTAACTTAQNSLTGSNGSTWTTLDSGVAVTFTPSSTGIAVLGGNADLWTSTAGFNQDLGIMVSGTGFPTTAGQPEAWKESGGLNGTFSPNAAFVGAVIPVTASTTYTAKLVWKTNHADSGTVFAGAGPVAGKFSQTCIDYRLIAAADVLAKSSTSQYTNTNSDGATWSPVDATNLTATMVAPADGVILASENADLWTETAGFNQDLGIKVGSAAQPAVWKESGGNGGTFSPNAAFGQTAISVTASQSVTAELVWKSNHSGTSKIHAGAGPIGGSFSPTKLTLLFLPTASAAIDKSSSTQYSLSGSDGATWQTIDFSRLTISFTPTTTCEVILGGGADLWTSKAGVNQDLGIAVTDTSFPSVIGQPEGWKESGGKQGTFSPNAAYGQIHVVLTAGQSYTIQLVWKANQSTTGTIYAGAGPIAGSFSQTHLTMQPLGC